MNNENEIERMAKILYAPELKKQNGEYGELCRGCNRWYEDEPCKEKYKCSYYTEIAKRLQKSDIGDKKQAVEEAFDVLLAVIFADAYHLPDVFIDDKWLSLYDLVSKRANTVITELYGEDE